MITIIYCFGVLLFGWLVMRTCETSFKKDKGMRLAIMLAPHKVSAAIVMTSLAIAITWPITIPMIFIIAGFKYISEV